MTIKMILASNTNGGIGLNGKIPWHIPEDLQYFQKVTDGQTVLMGNNTWISLQKAGLPKGLPNRINKVITSQHRFLSGNKRKEHYISMGVVKSKMLPHAKFYNEKVWIIGGASIYEQLLPFVEEIHHTCVKGEYSCDTFVDTGLWVYSPDWKMCETKILCDNATVNIWRKV